MSSLALTIDYGGHSSKGIKDENQDAFSFKESKASQLSLKGHIGIIADGVSSANCAQQASQLAVCHFVDEYLATPESWSVEKSASTVLSSLNQWLSARQRIMNEHQEYEQWFTTFSAIVLRQRTLTIFHVGDCQIVKINQDGYQVLTQDHATNNGVLNRALGASSHLEVDRITDDINPNDTIMLCCDGVHNFVKPTQIRQLITQHKNLETASQAITSLAVEQGSTDNVTCLLINILSVPKQEFAQLLFDRKQQIIPPAMPVGATLDHFFILELVEQSARSHIYLALDKLSQQQVILKVPSLYFSDDQNYLDAFIKEGWIGQQINDPKIMKILSPVASSQFLYHTCQVIKGMTLAQWHDENPFASLNDVKSIATQIVSALRALQRKDISHGDIKLDNFMIDNNTNITLIDLGSCEVGSMKSEMNQIPLGTLTYSAPERFYGNRNTSQSDLFSLGVIMYQLLSGRFPYKSIEHLNKAPKNYSHWVYLPIKDIRDDLSPWIDLVLSKSVAADPNNRYQSYSQLLTELNSPAMGHYHNEQHKPLIDRDPITFWKLISGVLFIVLMVSLFR